MGPVHASVRASMVDDQHHDASHVVRPAPRTAKPAVARRRAAAPSGVSGPAAADKNPAPVVGLAGGELDGATESHIRASSGTALTNGVRARMEPAFGVDLGHVRIHRGVDVNALNADLSARAFTVGSDIFMSDSAGRSTADDGERVLAHELAHVVQQSGDRASRIVRRAVGFEFEDGSWSTFKLQPGSWLRHPPSLLNPFTWGWGSVKGGTVAPPGSEKTDDEKAVDVLPGKNIWAGAGGNHINSFLGDYNLQTAPKKGKLHKGVGYRIEPDGPYTTAGYTNRMDLEIVTSPFPETENGLAALDAALRDMRTVFSRYDAGASGEWAGGPLNMADLVSPTQHQFSTKDVYLYGGKRGGEFKPQVTSGIPLAKLPEMMRTLGGPGNETRQEVEAREPIRKLVYGKHGDPADLEKSATTALVGQAPGLAAGVVAGLVANEVIDDDAAGRRALEGLVSLALVYMVVLSIASQEGIKVQLPFLSRLSFAALFQQIPDPVRSQLAAGTWLDHLATALDGGIRLFMGLRLYEKEFIEEACAGGLDGPMVSAWLKEDVSGQRQRATRLESALGSFTRRQWLAGFINGQDLLKPTDLIAKLGRSDDPERKAVADEYGKSVGVFLRGHANTASVRDVEGEKTGSLALLENRNITNGPLTFDQAELLARTYFEWLVKLRAAT
jgi:hypothetical protein